MRKVDIPQGSPGWLRWRGDGVTASNAAVILGLSPHKTALTLWRELVGLCEPVDISMIDQVRKGHLREPLAAEWFQERHGSVTGPCCGESVINPIMRASFDAFYGKDPLEIKNLSDSNHLEVLSQGRNSTHYELYFWQVQHQMYVSGADTGYLLFWNPVHTPICFEIKRSEEAISKLLKANLEFFENVKKGIPPDFDLSRDTYFINRSWKHYQKWRDASQEIKTLLDLRTKLSNELKTINNKLDERKSQLRPDMGNHYAVEGAGLRLCNSQRDGSINWETVAKSLIPESDYYKFEEFRSQTSVSLRVSISNKDIDDSSVLKPEQKPDIVAGISHVSLPQQTVAVASNELSFDW